VAKRGRPPKHRDELKSEPISFRITEDLRARLEQSRRKEAPARTLSQEIEARLLLSFGEPQRIEDLLGGRTTSALLRAIAEHIRGIEASTGKTWWQDRYTHEQCCMLVAEMLRAFAPKGRRVVPSDVGKYALGERGALIAIAQLEMLFKNTLPGIAEDAPAQAKADATSLVPKITSSAINKLKREHRRRK
jgi:hypothetical protein